MSQSRELGKKCHALCTFLNAKHNKDSLKCFLKREYQKFSTELCQITPLTFIGFCLGSFFLFLLFLFLLHSHKIFWSFIHFGFLLVSLWTTVCKLCLYCIPNEIFLIPNRHCKVSWQSWLFQRQKMCEKQLQDR